MMILVTFRRKKETMNQTFQNNHNSLQNATKYSELFSKCHILLIIAQTSKACRRSVNMKFILEQKISFYKVFLKPKGKINEYVKTWKFQLT